MKTVFVLFLLTVTGITGILIPEYSFAQIKLNKWTLFNNNVELYVPDNLVRMKDEMWKIKYPNRSRPILVLTDANGEINLIGDLTRQAATESQITAYKDFRIAHLNKERPDVKILEQGVKTVDGKKVGYFKFISRAIDQYIFNYYFFLIADGKIMLFTFNCIQKLQDSWEKTADQIVLSLHIK